MKQLAYSNKAEVRRYICADCLRDAGGVDVNVLGAYFQVSCSICGNIGLHQRTSQVSYDKAVKALRLAQKASK